MVEYRVDESPTRCVLHVRGEIDLATAEQFQERLGDLARTGRAVIVNLADVAFFSASGLSALEHGHLACREHGRCLAVVAPPGGICRLVIDVTRFGGIVRVFDALAAAVGAAEQECTTSGCA